MGYYNRMKLVKLTPDNANLYIGFDALFKTRNRFLIKKINGVSITCKTIYIDQPDLHNCLEIVSRNVYVIVG